MFNGINDTFDERQDAHGQRHLGTLFKIAKLVACHAQPGFCHLFVLLLQQVVKLMVFTALAIHAVEEPQQTKEQNNGCHNGNNHQVELADSTVENACSRFQLTVLACLLLQVDIDVTIVVALLLVVDGGIGHTELFADARHQVGSLIYALVG